MPYHLLSLNSAQNPHGYDMQITYLSHALAPQHTRGGEPMLTLNALMNELSAFYGFTTATSCRECCRRFQPKPQILDPRASLPLLRWLQRRMA